MCKHVFTHTSTFLKREMKKYWVSFVFFQLYLFFVFLCFVTRFDRKTKGKQRKCKVEKNTSGTNYFFITRLGNVLVCVKTCLHMMIYEM